MNELASWLTLNRIPGIGPSTFKLLTEHFGSPSNVLSADKATLVNCGLKTQVINKLLQAKTDYAAPDIDWLEQNHDHHIITYQDAKYPNLLQEIPGDPPPLLFVKGNLDVLNKPQIAIVGSRNPSPTGKENAFSFAKALSRSDIAITSGLALGIDAIAHKGALDGNSQTIAVCATGLDTVYPKNHCKLARDIIENGGALVSEFPIGTQPKREHFPRRNRIISGLSYGTLVIEAALKSGSLITARYAAEQDREVFAIPSSIHNPLSKGCHMLIKQGAKLTESVEDIVEELKFLSTNQNNTHQTFQESIFQPITLKGDYLKVFSELGYEPTPIDTVIKRSGLTADAVSSILLELELQRYITSTTGGFYARER